MGKVQRIEIENFKSYRGRHIIGPFEQFTCIIGPNGSGKSNLMDAISFVLAISTKYLRSQNLQELIYNNENDEYGVNTCNVSLFYLTDETDHELNEKVNSGEEIEFFRRVNSNGSSQYKVNGKQVTSESYIQKLAEFNILVNCRNFLVYQGDVQNISTRSPEELTILFEQISGSYNLHSEYEKLRDRREKLKAVMDMNLKKKYTMISERKVVQEQKEEADEFQKKMGLLRDLRVEYFLWQLFNIESNLEEHSKKSAIIKEKEKEIENTEQSLRREKESKQREIVKVNEAIRKEEQKRHAFEEERKEKEPESIKCNDRLHRYENNLHVSEMESEKLKKEKETIEKEMVILQEEGERMKVSLETLQESIPQTQSGIVLSVEQKEEYNQLKQVYLQEAGELIQMNEIKKREEETLVSQIKQKNETLQNYLSEETNTKKMIEDLKGQSNRLHSTYQDVNRVIQSLEQESESLQNEYSTSYQLLQEKRAIYEEKKQGLQSDLSVREVQRREKERRACVSRLQELFPEVRGLLVDLINPIQKKYSLAVETALGSHLDAVIVTNKAVAIECIQFLKEQHMPAMDFYPLDSIKPKELRLDLRHQNCKLCFELLEYDNDIEAAVRYAVGNTVVAENLQIARQLAFENRIGEKIVTLDGEEIAKNGAMTGGLGKGGKGSKFQDKVIQKKQEEVDKLEEEIQELEKKLQRSARNSERMRTIESNLLTQRSKQRVFNEEISVLDKKVMEYSNRMNTISSSIHQIQEEVKELEKEEEKKTNELSLLLQKLHIIEKRVYGAFLNTIGIQSVNQLENEYFVRVQENEKMQNECKAHITLITDKIQYGKQRYQSIETSLLEEEKNQKRMKKKLEEVQKQRKEIQNRLDEIEEENEKLSNQIGNEYKKKKDIEIVISQIDQRLRENRSSLKKLDDQISSERSAMETLRSKRNAVLKSAILEQVQIPFIHKRSSQQSSGSMEIEEEEEESMEMEIESDIPQSQQFSQSQAFTVQQDQEQIDRIDFSSLGSNAIAVNENEYGRRDEEYRDKISSLAAEIDRMQPNMLAEQKFKDISEKVTLINQDRKELVANYNKANEEFKECSKKRKELFMEAYQQVESVIDETYKALTRSVQFTTGGQALLALTNPEEPYLGGIKYTVSPVGKQYRDISQLSGGEKTIATLALLFALHSFKKAPFFIMDEVDDALDNANVERVARYILECCQHTQCILISHKELLFEQSNSLVGVYHNWKEASSAILTIDLRKYDPVEEDE